ncbi:hypothetical protein HZY86_06335 [Aerococcaceae bacterium DSM 111020]|nr:hypothetical protein [Aerococcaceae bacterium DSM 111020]
MYDIHAHFLVGIDDGPATIEDAIELADAAVQEGITHVIVTPHHHNGMWQNHKEQVMEKFDQFSQALSDVGNPLVLRPSQEIQIQSYFFDEFNDGQYLSLDDSGKYYLIEFPWRSYPDYSEPYLQQLVDQGITPIIAHPERQRAFSEHPERLERLIDMGCIAQVTATSLVEPTHQRALDASYQMIRDGLIDVIASDAHHVIERPHNLNLAYDKIEQTFGEDTVKRFKLNAKAIFEGTKIIKE